MVPSRHLPALVVTATLAVGLAPAAPQETPAPPAQGMSLPAGAPQAAPPLPGGTAPDLDLVVTSQVAGWIEPCG
jgi:hypothetical protein